MFFFHSNDNLKNFRGSIEKLTIHMYSFIYTMGFVFVLDQS